ncbi:MAG: hypothetical protein KGM49_12760 [Sphingomonadales bacterium]|nr:hypothetical protein [Sphingomonadales bacterium]
MHTALSPRRFAIAGIVAVFALMLSACLLSPGKFVSTLDLRKDGRFTFSYTGEVYLLALSKMGELASKSQDQADWVASPCFKDDSLDQRPCTKDELDQQKAKWTDQQKTKAERDKKDTEMAQSLLGGIDPASPRAAEELAERLRHQAGWKSVIYKGDGLYQVDFAIAGVLDHDFTFPTIERFPMANSFVTLVRRADGAIRIDAPAFGPGGAGSGMSSFAQLAAMGAADHATKTGKSGTRPKDDGTPQVPQIDGTFSITTDAPILTNNTDNGPAETPQGQRLEWKITPRTANAPSALIKLAR